MQNFIILFFFLLANIDVQIIVANFTLIQVLFDQSKILYSVSLLGYISIDDLQILNSRFNNSDLISLSSNYEEILYTAEYFFSNFTISRSVFYCSQIRINAYRLRIKNFKFVDNIVTNKFLNLILDYRLELENLRFIGIKIDLYHQSEEFIRIKSQLLQINGISFQKLKTSNLLIKCNFSIAYLNNIEFISIEAYYQLLSCNGLQNAELKIENFSLLNVFGNQDQKINFNAFIFIQAESLLLIKYSNLNNIHLNQFILIDLNSNDTTIWEFQAKSVFAYVLLTTTAINTSFYHINLSHVIIQGEVFSIKQNYYDGNILIYDLFVNYSQSVKLSLIYVDSQQLTLIKFANMIFEKINSTGIVFILQRKTSQIYLQQISIAQSNLKLIIHITGKVERLTAYFVKLFEIQGISRIETNCESISLRHIIFKKVDNVDFQAKFNKFDVFNFMISDSLILIITFEDVSQCITNIAIINGLFLYNNRFLNILNIKLNGFVQNLQLIDNTLIQQDAAIQLILLLLKGQIKLQIIMLRNRCIDYCVVLDDKIKIDEEFSKQFLYQDNQKNIAILINNRILIKNLSLLYIPTGQQLINYQVFDKGELIQQFQNVQIIKNQENQDTVIEGQFNINAFEYNISQNNIIQDLTQYQTFNFFEQNDSYSGLNYYQINFNPYQQNIIMIVISQVGDLEKELFIFAQTQVCQIGEILYQDQCLVCDPKLQIYSVKQKSNFCQTVDTIMISDHQQGSINLRQGYWRPFIYSSQIEKCEGKFSQCQGGWHVGVDSCKIGYVGGICNACDQYNQRGYGYFQLENNICKLCGEFQYLNLFLEFLVIIIIYCLRLIFQKKIILQRSVNYKNFHIMIKYIQDMPPMIFNITIANLALLKFILQDYIDLPNMLTIFTNPIVFEKNSKTCLQLITNLNQTYWIQILRVIMPILTYNIFIILLIITSQNKNQLKNLFLFPILSLFFSQGPTILVLFIQQTLYVTYSKVRYAYLDYSIRYFSNSHQQNLKFQALPIIIIFSFILPLIVYLIIKRINVNLFKGQKYITGGNFILPYNNKNQEIFNYVRNVILLLILMLNGHFIMFNTKALIYILIIYIENQNTIHRQRKISLYFKQQGIWLVSLLIVSNNLNEFQLPITEILYILVSLFIIQSLKFYFKLLFFTNKLFICETFKNQKKFLFYLGLTNHIQCLNYWKSIKLNYKQMTRGKCIKLEQNINEIILKTLYTQQTDQSLVVGNREIEMIEL